MAKKTELGVDGTLRSVSETLAEETDTLVDLMLARMREEVPTYELDIGGELADALRASCYGNVRTALAALGSNREPPSSSPAEAVEEARATARAGVALEPLLHTYRIGHAVVLERLLVLIEEMDLSSAQRRGAVQIGSRYLFAYIDRVVSLVTEEYAAERDRMMRSSIQRRVQLVRDVLGGATISGSELGYELEQQHTAAIATGRDSERLLQEAADELGSSLLTVAIDERTVWAWFGSRPGAEEPLHARLRQAFSEAEAQCALGESRQGLDGFRETHEQARAAHRVAVRLPQRVTLYDDVALEAALMADSGAARRFVERELGPLAHDDGRTATLRETLFAYLGTGLNASSASAVLTVSDRTVAYRIRAIEELLGRNVSTRSAELSAALRLHRVFGS